MYLIPPTTSIRQPHNFFIAQFNSQRTVLDDITFVTRVFLFKSSRPDEIATESLPYDDKGSAKWDTREPNNSYKIF